MIKRPSLRAVPGELARAKIKAMVIEHLDDIVEQQRFAVLHERFEHVHLDVVLANLLVWVSDVA